MSAWAGFEAGVLGDAQRLCYRVGGDWSLVWPCSTCGGAILPLVTALEDLEDQLAECGERVRARTCPGCQTLAMRSKPSAAEPAVWYDTLLRDWVVRPPCRGRGEGPVIPLNLFWFDTPLSLVFASAADVVSVGGLLVDDLDHD
jgi:hypothetical protein